jgi:hypothetical protein
MTLRPFTTAHGSVVTSSLSLKIHRFTPSTKNESSIGIENNILPPRTAPAATVSKARVKRHYDPIEGINVDSTGHTDCHAQNEDYIYFTVAHPNGRIATTKEHQYALFFVESPWILSYWNTLRNSFLNNPTKDRFGDSKYESCKGNCYSEVIPNVQYWNHPVVLKRIEDPDPLRDGWHGSRCQYSTVHGITKKNVKLANIGHFIYGAQVPSEILDFMETEIRKTYPTLEITLVCLLTVGLVPCLFVIAGIIGLLIKLAHCLDTCIDVKCDTDTLSERRSSDTDVYHCGRQAYSLRPQAPDTQQQAYPLRPMPVSRPPTYKTYDTQWRVEDV